VVAVNLWDTDLLGLDLDDVLEDEIVPLEASSHGVMITAMERCARTPLTRRQRICIEEQFAVDLERENARQRTSERTYRWAMERAHEDCYRRMVTFLYRLCSICLGR
jgi:hypothetical protein